MAVFSTGTARAPGDPGYVNPNGQVSSFDAKTSCNYPAGFPKNKLGCPALSATKAYDSSGVTMDIRVPMNAKSFTYDFNFFSSEYPEYVCTAFNDAFVALLQTGYLPANPAANSNNISWDSKNNPVSVNAGFFSVTSGPKLTNTGLDGLCAGQICGGSTDWLETSAPVMPGETITIQLAIWDQSDHLWDSTVLVDNWKWSLSPASIQTTKPAAPPVPSYVAGSFTRDYAIAGLCPAGTSSHWGVWSWGSKTPGDSQIQFYVKAAKTQAGLANAVEYPLLFSKSIGPAAFAGKAAVAKAGNPDTELGSLVVQDSLVADKLATNLPYLRVRSYLVPTSDGTQAPTLTAWNLQYDCQASE